jgi:hypothetical protein
MILSLLLVLSGLLETGSQATARPGDSPAALAASAAQEDRSEPAPKVAPLQPRRRSSPLFPSLPKLLTPARSPNGTAPRETQLQNKRTGVTCTLRILRIDPPVDKDMVATAPERGADHMARNELSPCVE